MAITVGTDSYISLADAETYFAGRLHSDAWDSASELDKEKALKTATKRIDMLSFRGRPVDTEQALAFPRYILGDSGYLFTVDITQKLEDATCEEAIALLEQTDFDLKREKMKEAGVTSVSAGDSSESYSERDKGFRLLSPYAQKLISPYLQKAAWIV